jgi:hypothetical protein
MTPKFPNPTAWHQAEILMQPAFIRVIDNIRKQLEQTTWKGSYESELHWPEATSEATKAQVLSLQEQLQATKSEEEAIAIEEQLAQLPQPFATYLLRLENQDHTQEVDLWQLCYQICFRNYGPQQDSLRDQVIEIDTTLLDDSGAVDWQRLDQKTKHIIAQIFESFSDSTSELQP